jgi:hypothetical protein
MSSQFRFGPASAAQFRLDQSFGVERISLA